MNPTPYYEEIVDFIASGTTPESVVAFRPTKAAMQRVEELTAKNGMGLFRPMSNRSLTTISNSSIC